MCRPDRRHVAHLPVVRGAGSEVMSVVQWIGLALTLGIGAYLVVALLYPEKFQ